MFHNKVNKAGNLNASWRLGLRRLHKDLRRSLVHESLVDVRNNTTTSNRSLDESVQFLVTPDGELQVSRSDTLHLEILRSISSQLENFSGEILKNRRRVDSGCGTHTTVSRNTRLQHTVYPTDRELKTSTSSTAHWGLLALSGTCSRLANTTS